MRVELRGNGWKLFTNKDGFWCWVCKKEIPKTPFYLCLDSQRFFCKKCNNDYSCGFSKFGDTHEHYNIIEVGNK